MPAVICKQCGTEAHKPQSLINRSVNHFCSHKCYNEWRTGKPVKHFTGITKTAWNKGLNIVEVECPNCGETITRYGHLKHKYCSYDCYVEYLNNHPETNPRRTGVTKNCLTCGSKFYVPQYRVEVAKFCSVKCYQESNYKRQLLTKIPTMETTKHLDLKEMVIEKLTERGYEIDTEKWVTVNDKHYRIDVYATKDDKKKLIECGRCPQAKIKALRENYDAVIHIPYNQIESIMEGL